MNMEPFGRQLLYLEILIRFQRVVRMALRAVWLAMGAYLVSWSLHTLFGWLPDPRHWIRAAVFVGILTLTFAILPWHNRKRLTWRLDRRLGGKEQISTAWQVILTGESGTIAEALVSDATSLISSFRKRILRRGWRLFPDLLSGIILALLIIVITSTAPVSYEIPGEISIRPLPAFVPEPGYKDIFPEGNAGLQKLADHVDQDELTQSGHQTMTLGDVAQLADTYQSITEAFYELGKELRDNAATYEIGEALMNMEIEQAASALENLSTSAGQLSPETLEDLANSLQDAAGKLDQNNSLTLLPNFQQAASAIVNENPSENVPSAQDSLEKIAGDLRDLAGMMKSPTEGSADATGADSADEMQSASGGTGAGLSAASQTGPAERFERLSGEGGAIELDNLSESVRTALRPGAPSHNLRPGTTTGSRSSVLGGSSEIFEVDLVPYRYPWRWRDVVSKYFSP